ncbi:MAG: 2-oxoacid:acceptor oxidoreductase family protein [archaeon]|nr:2-oxoacid:acceptor oxidoreductase family protein [archaeon]
MKINILIKGQAGKGPNILAKIIGNVFTKWGYYIFISRDYGSFIRGGTNSNQITISDKLIMSNENKTDVLVSLEKNEDNLFIGKKVIEKEGEENMYFAGRLAKLFGIDFEFLEEELKKLGHFEDNLANAKKGYDDEEIKFKLEKRNIFLKLLNGAETSAEGAIKSGLDTYFAYPMTPATSLMIELAAKQYEKNFFVLELENEIAVVNAALGAAITGAKSMIGTSGGGFDLMTEALSMSGVAEIPIVVYLASRPGPGTGVATYTSQGDMDIARHFGHGEFPRVLTAPGDPTESEEVMGQAFYLSQKYKIPFLILTDKHLAESLYSCEKDAVVIKSQKNITLGRYNSYESDEKGVATENPEIIKKNIENRLRKKENIAWECENFEMFKIHGKKDSKNAVIFWGSTKGAVLDAISELDVKGIQIIYLEPFSSKIADELKKMNKIIVIENNATSPLSALIAEKTGIMIKDKILRYDGWPFFSDELRKEIENKIGGNS